jgi:hypothetical protein
MFNFDLRDGCQKKKEADPKMAEPEYTANDVKKAAGLSYRQLNNWNSKGALPGERQGEEGWHKFTPRDIFALMVCSEIRKQFHVPLESIKWIQSFMQQQEANHLAAAIEIISTYGFTVWLLTDCKTTFIMDSDLEFEDLFNLGYFRADGPQGYIFLKINPIVNRLLSCLKTPIELKTHHRIYSTIHKGRMEQSTQSPQEFEVLRLVRDGGYDRISVQLKNGKIISAETEEEIPDSDRKRLLEIIEQNKYQTVTIKKHDGKIVRLSRKIPFKFSDFKSSSSSPRQNKPEEGSER